MLIYEKSIQGKIFSLGTAQLNEMWAKCQETTL